MIQGIKDIVNFEDWEKLDLRVGQIIQIEDISGADRLYKLTINLGDEIWDRIVCAGIKEHYSKEQLKDKKVILFVNLKPRKLKGIESQGMILATVSNNKVYLLSVDNEVELGSKVS